MVEENENLDDAPAAGDETASEPVSAETEDASPVADGPSPEELLDQAQADLASAVSPDLDLAAAVSGQGGAAGELLSGDSASPYEFEAFDDGAPEGDENAPLDALDDVELDLRIELGRTELLIEEVLQLKPGSVVPLDKLAGDPVDIHVNGRLIARGEVLVLNDNFCVRVAEILAPDN